MEIGPYLPTGGLPCSLAGDAFTNSERCRPAARDRSLKECLVFADDFPAPYFDEKLSGWRDDLDWNMIRVALAPMVPV